MNLSDPKNTKPPPIKPLNHIIKYYSNSNVKYEEYDLNENGLRDGLYERWYPNGQLHIRLTFKNGLRHGLHNRWHDNGRLWVSHNFKNNFCHGLFEVYDSNGTLESKYYYRNGKFEY